MKGESGLFFMCDACCGMIFMLLFSCISSFSIMFSFILTFLSAGIFNSKVYIGKEGRPTSEDL